MPDDTLLSILAEIDSIDGRIARNGQRVEGLLADNRALSQRRDELCGRGTKALTIAKVTANHVDGPNGTTWHRAGGSFEKLQKIDAATVAVPGPCMPPLATEPKIVDSPELRERIQTLLNSKRDNIAYCRQDVPPPPTGTPEAAATLQNAAKTWEPPANETAPETVESSLDLLDRISCTDHDWPYLKSNGYSVLPLLALIDSGMSREGVLKTSPDLTWDDLKACELWRQKALREAGKADATLTNSTATGATS